MALTPHAISVKLFANVSIHFEDRLSNWRILEMFYRHLLYIIVFGKCERFYCPFRGKPKYLDIFAFIDNIVLHTTKHTLDGHGYAFDNMSIQDLVGVKQFQHRGLYRVSFQEIVTKSSTSRHPFYNIGGKPRHPY